MEEVIHVVGADDSSGLNVAPGVAASANPSIRPEPSNPENTIPFKGSAKS